MKVTIPATRVAEFKAIIQTGKYREDERGYKWANHLALRSIFKNASASKLAARLSKLFGRFKPDLDDLGLNQEDQAEWHEAVAGKSWNAGKIIHFLSGSGQFASRNYDWIPDAIGVGHGAAIADAFRRLHNDHDAVGQRVEEFQHALRDIHRAAGSKRRGTSAATVSLPSLAFVGSILFGLDPTRYTSYNKGAIEHGLRTYASRDGFSSGSAGKKYEESCDLVASIYEALKRQGVPVINMIDAQSFVWISEGNQWKDYVLDPEEEDVINFVEDPGREPNAKVRKAIEDYAVARVTKYYERAGWTIRPQGAPYDLECTEPNREPLFVEVKGSRGPARSVLLTPNEVDHARSHHPNTALAVVHGIKIDGTTNAICSGGTLEVHERWRPNMKDLTVTTYTYRRPSQKRG
jgi:Domain of unknown function (DUF3883)